MNSISSSTGREKHILIIGSYFLPRASANGVCLHNIVKEYIKEGHNVYYIAPKEPNQKEYEIIDGIHIYRVKQSWFTAFHEKYSNGGKIAKAFDKVMHLLRNIFLIPYYPNVAPVRSKKVYAIARKIVNEKNIDIVIASYVPYEAIYTALHLKRKFGSKLFCVSYYLDYLCGHRYTSFARHVYEHSCAHSLKKDFRFLDRVIIPLTSRNEFEKQYGVHANVRFSELPVYVKGTSSLLKYSPFEKETINLVFIGSLNTWNRSPERLLKLLKSVSQKIPNIRLHIWGDVTNTKGILDRYHAFVEYHGYTESKYIPTILQNADWVVNISNKRDFHLVPSKIFQLFASGKPILNYVFDRNDVSLPYFERYENTYWVYDDEANSEVTVTKLAEALQKKWLPLNVDELYRGNMPEVVAEKILRGFDKKE